MKLYLELVRKNIFQINTFGHFSLKRPLRKFSDKVLVENIMTYLLKKKKNVFNKYLFQKLRILHIRIAHVLPHLLFSMQFCQF